MDYMSVAEKTHFSSIASAPDRPAVLRGYARHWPAVRTWDFDHIAALAPERKVTLVVGNRERERTIFAQESLGACLMEMKREDGGARPIYLKEFDLLNEFPALRNDVLCAELFPRRAITSNQVWIGPAKSRTGLHFDYLRNLAVTLYGRKRFHLARPGTVERLGLLSSKYDRWATLAQTSFDELRDRGAKPEELFVIDLDPGDVLYVPKRWWHEVVNLQPSILLSGFFGGYHEVASLWLRTGMMQTLHDVGWWRQGQCTCHAA